VSRRDKGAERTLALERMERLLAQARAEAVAGRLDLADRYAGIASTVAEKYQTGVPRHLKPSLCRACTAYLLPGVTSRTRTAAGRVATTCLRCGNVARRPLKARARSTTRVPTDGGLTRRPGPRRP